MRRTGFLIFLLFLLAANCLAAASDEPVNLSADSLVLNQETGLYRAEGNVQIRQGDLLLTSGSADWDQQSGEAVCGGGFRMESADGVLTGDSIRYDFGRGLGQLSNGQARLSAYNVFLSGDLIEKRGDISYRVSGGSFTTCPGESPAWKLTASRLDVDVEGYARARNAVFYLRNIPVLYLPYIALPAKTERQSGLLFPEISHSSRLGNRYRQPLYLVIDQDLDATLEIDYMSDLGIGTGLEFRYLPPQSRTGRLYTNFISGFDDEPDRSLTEWDHDGLLPGQVRLVIDAEYVSEKDYYEIFGRTADDYNREKVQSIVYLSRGWNQVNLSAQAKYNRDLEQSSATQLQYLPEVRFDYLPQRWGQTPIFTSFLAEPGYLWHRDGPKGGRLRLQPMLATDLLVNRYLEMVPTVSWLQRNYRFNDVSEQEGLPIATLSVGSRVARVFTFDTGDVTHLRHVVEPMVHYLFIPNVDQGHLPQFDSRDRIDPVNLVTFELMNRLTTRSVDDDGTPRFREVGSLRLAVDYDIRERKRDPGPLPDQNRPFSPVRGELIIRPTPYSFLRGDIAYDANDNARYVESRAVWGGLHDRHGNGLLINYQYLKNDFDYLSGGVDLALFDPLFVSYEHRRDLETVLMLEAVTRVEYRGECWSVMFGFSDRPDEDKYEINFSLSGLSKNRLLETVIRPLKNFL
ncbi:MAG: hypothetical protein C0623_06070 [Desulfuromonas sp.]|nr:MAG: hypothetical protein C0623_06070 [Desulfuromonas sp.]